MREEKYFLTAGYFQQKHSIKKNKRLQSLAAFSKKEFPTF
jgi:hypothetical protein